MKKENIKKYIKSIFFINAPFVINVIISLVVLPIILLSLDVEDYGKYQFVLALQIWISAVTGSHIILAAKRGIARGLNGTFIYAIFSRLKILAIASIILLIVATYFKISGNSVFSILFLIFAIYIIFGDLAQTGLYEFLIAKKKFKSRSFWQLLISSVSLIGSAVVAYFTNNIIYFAIFSLGIISVLSWIGLFGILKKENIIESYKKGEVDKECVPYGLKLIPANLISSTANKISNYIIGPFFGFANLAVFSVANKLRDKFITVMKSIDSLFYADFARRDRNELIRIVNRYIIKFGVLGILATIIFICIGSLYIKYFLPETFNPAIEYFIILSLGIPASFISQLLHTILVSHLRYKELSIIGTIPNIIRIGLIIIFGYIWQIKGICIAIAVSNWITISFYYLLTVKKDFAKRIIEKYPLFKKISKY